MNTESELNRQATLRNLDFTKPQPFADGWRSCEKYIRDNFFTKQQVEEACRKTLEEQWIKVEDRLPDEDVNVLCYSHSDYIEGYYSSVTKRFHPEIEDAGYMEDDMMVIDVTHWQPLPSPPHLKG